MGAIQTGSGKVLTEGKMTARVGDGVLVTAAEVAAAIGSKLKAPTPPKNTGVGSDTGLPPSSGGAGGSYEPALDYEGNLQPGVPGAVTISLDASGETKYGTLQDFVNLNGSAGLLTGCELTISGNTVAIAEGTALLRTEATIPSAIKFFDVSGMEFNISDATFFGVTLDGDVAKVVSSATDDFDAMTSFRIGSAQFINGELVVLDDPVRVSDAVAKVVSRFVETRGIERAGTGLELTGDVGRSLTLSGV